MKEGRCTSCSFAWESPRGTKFKKCPDCGYEFKILYLQEAKDA